MTEQEKRETREMVINGLEHCLTVGGCGTCPYFDGNDAMCNDCFADALTLMKSSRTQFEVQHAVSNVDIPENVTEEQFYSVMGNVSEALVSLFREAT